MLFFQACYPAGNIVLQMSGFGWLPTSKPEIRKRSRIDVRRVFGKTTKIACPPRAERFPHMTIGCAARNARRG
jgi:hypothetical protein